MKHRIAVVVPGGVGKSQNIPSLVQLLDRLSASYLIRVYSFSGDELHPLLEAQGVEVVSPPNIFLKHKTLAVCYFLLKITIDHLMHAFSMIHAFWILPSGLTVMALNRVLRLPFVLSLPGGDTVHMPSIHYGGMRSGIFRWLVRRCCSSANRVVMLTWYQKTEALRNGVLPGGVRIVPFGVDTAQFSYRPKALSEPLQLISIGSINRVKNIFLQVDTLALLSRDIDCRLTIVGKDILRGQVHAYAESRNVGHLINWMGKCGHDELPALLHASHLLLHTAWYEAEGVAMMEAFAAGTVVVGPRVGLLAEMDVDGECSVERHNAGALTEKILSIVRDPKLYARLQEKHRRYAEEYTIDRTAAEYRRIYKEMCGSAFSIVHAVAAAR